MKHYLLVQADTNDADYVQVMNEISEEDLARVRPLIEAIKNFQPYKSKSKSDRGWRHTHNFPWGENYPRTDLGEKSVEEIYSHIDPDVVDLFKQEYVPSGDIHSIDSIIIYEIASETVLL